MMGVQEVDAAAYIRVSTRSDAQMHSFDFQEEYWRNEIASKPGYKLKAIYADKGISGKAIYNRKQYLNMIAAAKRGEFKTIFTKSVSRFGRNTEELLETVRELKECGINVIFESENIDTAIPGCEFRLTIAAAVAAEQLKAYGQNIQWAIRDKFEKGEILIGRMLGYKLNKGKLEIVENEAEIVRLIYCLYIGGMGKQGIANELTRRGIPTYLGGERWSMETVSRILQNEKYVGRCIQQKSITIDGKVFRRHDGTKYEILYSHEPIVSQEIWDKAQEIRAERKVGKEYTVPPDYAFRSKIVCGICGKGFIHKINNGRTKYAKAMWKCVTAGKYGKGVCASKTIFDEVIEPLFIEAYNEFVQTRERFIVKSDIMLEKEKLLESERKLKSLWIKGLIPQAEYKNEMKQLLDEIAVIDVGIKKAAMNDINGKSAKPILTFDKEAVREYLDEAVINDHTVTFKFVNGCSITKQYTNGTGGNKKGWMERRKA